MGGEEGGREAERAAACCTCLLHVPAARACVPPRLPLHPPHPVVTQITILHAPGTAPLPLHLPSLLPSLLRGVPPSLLAAFSWAADVTGVWGSVRACVSVRVSESECVCECVCVRK